MNRLRELRRKKGLNQEALAQMLNIKQTTISNWENNRTQIDQESIMALADFFDVSIDYLLGRKNPEFFSAGFRDNTVVSIGRGGEKRIYEIDEQDAEFVDTFLKKVAKKK